MERGLRHAKYGRFSRKPYIDMIIPTLVYPSMAPPGKHVISSASSITLRTSSRRSWGLLRPSRAFGRLRSSIRCGVLPEHPRRILHRNVQTPLDMSAPPASPRATSSRASLSLEQLFFKRPGAGLLALQTPIRDLWLCGSATHPAADHGRKWPVAAWVLRARGRKAA